MIGISFLKVMAKMMMNIQELELIIARNVFNNIKYHLLIKTLLLAVIKKFKIHQLFLHSKSKNNQQQ
jgi:hypothetical protein